MLYAIIMCTKLANSSFSLALYNWVLTCENKPYDKQDKKDRKMGGVFEWEVNS